MSDQTKKRPFPLEDDNNTSTRNESKRKRRPPKRCPTQSEYDDTGWCAPSDFKQESESTPIDPQKECEEAVRLLTEFSQRAHKQMIQTDVAGGSSEQQYQTPTRKVDTISSEDLASLSCEAGPSGQFESPSSLSSPALVISTTPPKKAGKKRKLQSSAKPLLKSESSQSKQRGLKTPEKQRSKLLIATRQLLPRTPPKSGFKSKKMGVSLKRTPTKTDAGKEEESPRKSARIASLDHHISWKKGKKQIKKVKKKKKKSLSSESESEGWQDEEEENESINLLEFDSDLEAKLEENAARNNLTAINVKSILHVSNCNH